MPFKIIYSPDEKYLAATDLLIGDMSDINYEFLIFNRPIILLANKWVKKNWPDIGYKFDEKKSDEVLEKKIKLSLTKKNEFENQRKIALSETIELPLEGSSLRFIEKSLEFSEIKNPIIYFIHGNSDVKKTNLIPLFEEAQKQNLKTILCAYPPIRKKNHHIYFGAHYEDLPVSNVGFKIHIDHAPKGIGAANLQISENSYKKKKYFPWINLHITAGESGYQRTKRQLGPLSNRTIIGGYPKGEFIKKMNTKDNRKNVCKLLNFDIDLPIITYASAGPLSIAKPGGSYSKRNIDMLKKIAERGNYNILIKNKTKHPPLLFRAINKILRIVITNI